MDELIVKAAQTANVLVSDLTEAYRQASAATRPEGRTLGDKALTAYLEERLAIARMLESDLLRLS
jgi:hypothetical protein